MKVYQTVSGNPVAVPFKIAVQDRNGLSRTFIHPNPTVADRGIKLTAAILPPAFDFQHFSIDIFVDLEVFLDAHTGHEIDVNNQLTILFSARRPGVIIPLPELRQGKEVSLQGRDSVELNQFGQFVRIPLRQMSVLTIGGQSAGKTHAPIVLVNEDGEVLAYRVNEAGQWIGRGMQVTGKPLNGSLLGTGLTNLVLPKVEKGGKGQVLVIQSIAAGTGVSVTISKPKSPTATEEPRAELRSESRKTQLHKPKIGMPTLPGLDRDRINRLSVKATGYSVHVIEIVSADLTAKIVPPALYLLPALPLFIFVTNQIGIPVLTTTNTQPSPRSVNEALARISEVFSETAGTTPARVVEILESKQLKSIDQFELASQFVAHRAEVQHVYVVPQDTSAEDIRGFRRALTNIANDARWKLGQPAIEGSQIVVVKPPVGTDTVRFITNEFLPRKGHDLYARTVVSAGDEVLLSRIDHVGVAKVLDNTRTRTEAKALRVALDEIAVGKRKVAFGVVLSGLSLIVEILKQVRDRERLIRTAA